MRDVTQTVITCNSVAGVGAGLFWTVTVASQSSAPSVNSTSYPAPTLTLVTGVGAVDADTAGGQQVTLIGLDFGPIVNPLPWPINATYGPVSSPSISLPCCSCCVIVLDTVAMIGPADWGGVCRCVVFHHRLLQLFVLYGLHHRARDW